VIESNIAALRREKLPGHCLEGSLPLLLKDTRDREHKAPGAPYPAEAGHSSIGGAGMNNTLARLYIRLHDLRRDERGQDLVEYALLLSLICLALISGISGIARAATTVFSNISSSLA
jgi:Flp pilus assembly pilin Flp